MLGKGFAQARQLVPATFQRLQHTAIPAFPSVSTHKVQLERYRRQNPEAQEKWEKRLVLRKPVLQCDEVLPPKIYHAPEWDLDKRADKFDGPPDPMLGYGMTPEKWEYYNKVVWPPNYVVPETGLPKPREVFHCRESLRFSPKRMWHACQLVWTMNIDEALIQLDLQQSKACRLLAEVLQEAKNRAAKEFHIEYPSQMHVAEAFPIQSQIIKGARRHARENWNLIRYRYIHIFVRLEEGDGPGFRKRNKPSDGWDHMRNYYDHLRDRTGKKNRKERPSMLRRVKTILDDRFIRSYCDSRFQSILERNNVRSPFEDPTRNRVVATRTPARRPSSNAPLSSNLFNVPINARLDDIEPPLKQTTVKEIFKEKDVPSPLAFAAKQETEIPKPMEEVRTANSEKIQVPPIAGGSGGSGDGTGSEEANDEEARKRRERMARNTKIGMFVVLGTAAAYFAGFCIYYGRSKRDEDGKVIVDEFADAGFMAPFYRIASSIKLWKDYVVEPARDKLLPDPIQPPYIQPKYTLVIEMKNVLVAPEWTYKTGYRFIKRPALDYFLDVVGYPNFEVVIYTSESNFTGPPVVESIDPKGRIMYKLYRDCTKYMKGVHVKDLSKLNRDLSKVIYIDFDPASFQLNPDNVLRMPKWEGEMSDTALVDLAELLKTIHLSDVDDVRPTLQYYSSFDNPAAEFRKRAMYLAEQEAEKQRQLENKDDGLLKRYSGRLFGFRRHEYAK
ncbi:unnamed protein product, partial [Mesorhabditis belari]|uniref:Small C-terminal domain Phosphatase protein 4 n=1 Tax=Mesorhabditis belari TaxID=2138241 RepID=A0AAF3EMG4_9BILA